jgi:translation initiation factor 1
MGSKKHDGIVYSTDPNFRYDDNSNEVEATLPPGKQQLTVWIDSKGRNGKIVTLIKGYQGKSSDLEALGTALKKHCGTGGSVKEMEIILQGNFRDKVLTFLSTKGYKSKKAGG